MVDRTILGIDHLYRRPVYARTKECSINYPENGPLPPDAPSWCQAPFDPEGLLSSVMAIVTCLIGLQFGHIIIHFEKHWGRITNWLIPSFSMLAVAFLMDFVGKCSLNTDQFLFLRSENFIVEMNPKQLS